MQFVPKLNYNFVTPFSFDFWCHFQVGKSSQSIQVKTLIYHTVSVCSQEVQILKALVLGEEERGQSQYQVMCFVCHVNKDEFISSDAMSKLRQVSFICIKFIVGAIFCVERFTIINHVITVLTCIFKFKKITLRYSVKRP